MSVRRLHHEQPESFEFTPENLAWAKKVIERYPTGRQASAVVPVLWRVQEQNEGWVSEPAIRVVAALLDMPRIRVLEVATFYTMFQLQPVGKKAHVQVCGTTPCQLRGSEELIKVCKSKIAETPHTLSEDGNFSWEEVECLGACVNAPMVQVFKDFYEDLDVEKFERLLDDIAGGKPVMPGPQGVDRIFSAPEGGPTTLKDLEDTTKGAPQEVHVVDGSHKASFNFAGAALNIGGTGYTGVPHPAEDAVAKAVEAHRKSVEAKAAASEKGEG
ncbi:NADH-quinone oxidoreductase subunit NuoE [Pseudovibrio sp. Tun.PSC04-5.I4]|uniref:NADH-quinone oxidoreductase subunit NuoE n=1 Tax=Pseudovibrio sp. Tun.PSC04-5.I4 TaxID=1798213 RepID=UPI00088B8FFF|nr:NADH-quinone oxidoreductase subunit NuoE [Pseudovibrio sp. Tun.PSC04-5.I4]SDR08620.1 NADH dehydrogenase subunit E [Pseudovibrio sp. Tun.PSC04-5.I4]